MKLFLLPSLIMALATGFSRLIDSRWLPDGLHVLVVGADPDGSTRAKLVGFDGGLLHRESACSIRVPVDSTPQTEAIHLVLEHLPDAARAGTLAAFVQGCGFLLTAAGPWLMGWWRERGGQFAGGWSWQLAIVLAMLLLTARFSPASYPRSMRGL